MREGEVTSNPPKVTPILMARWSFRVGGLTLILLLGSLACYSQKNVGWAAPDKYNIDVKHTVLGLPHWLVINRWEVRGTPPPVHQLPDGGVYRRGWHVNPIRLVVATLLWAVTAAILLWISSVVSPPAAYWPYGVALGLAAVIGAAMPTGATGPTWISPASILGLLAVILVVAAVLGRSYWYASATGIASMILLWASSRIADVLGNHFLYGPPGEDDLMAAAMFIPAALIIALAATFCSRSMAARARHN